MDAYIHENDTIAAAATAFGSAGIGIIRISGGDAFAVLKRIFRPADKSKDMQKVPGYTVHYGHIVENGCVLDEVLVTILKAPHSYTAEDTAEINCHGGRLVMQKIFEAAVRNGARPADPGEFTKRAFLNGRIDLSQAEAVMDLIDSHNNMALASSISQLHGSVKKKITKIREEILYENAFLGAALDDPEHMSLDGYPQRLRQKLVSMISDMTQMIEQADRGRILKEGIKTAIVGKPNVGKSTLMNAMLRKERSIVTEVAGTTRDVIEEQMQLGDISLILLDTAGIHETEELVEKIGVDKAKVEIGEADLVLFVMDATEKPDERDTYIWSLAKNRDTIILINKTDLEDSLPPEEILGSLEMDENQSVIKISAKTGGGLEELEKEIKGLFINENIDFNNEVIITNIRHKNLLSKARDSLELVKASVDNGMPEDFYTIDLTDAYKALGYIIGEEAGEDLIDEIFEKFCMGK